MMIDTTELYICLGDVDLGSRSQDVTLGLINFILILADLFSRENALFGRFLFFFFFKYVTLACIWTFTGQFLSNLVR